MLLNIPQHTALLSTAKNMPIVLGCLSLGTCPVIRARFLILSPVYALCHWNNSMIWNKLLDTRWPREMSFSEMVTYGIARDKILLWMDRALAESPGLSLLNDSDSTATFDSASRHFSALNLHPVRSSLGITTVFSEVTCNMKPETKICSPLMNHFGTTH